MAKKLILTQKQIDEICGGDSSYLDGLSSTPDMGNIFGKEVSAVGSMDNGYADPITTDDYSHSLSNDWRGNAKLNGLGVATIREMKKSEWEKKMLGEEQEHGNERLKHMQFGSVNGENGKNYDSTKMNISRYNDAIEKSRNNNPIIKQQGLNTMARMEKNWPGIKNAITQYSAAKKNDTVNQKTITSAPKNSGNGKAHTPKNGIITN